MANWTPTLTQRAGGLQNPIVEPPNAVAYIDWASDDNRSELNVRVPYALESDLLNYLAQDAQRRSALDDRMASISAEVSGTALVAGDPIALPDISGLQAVQSAQIALNQKIATAQLQSLIAIDPTIADAQTAVTSAQTAVTTRLASSAQPGKIG